MSCGIYKIKNIKNNKSYIGCSVNIESRWRQHEKMLNDNRHHSIKLQNSWNKYGKDSFTFEIIEECERESLFIVENLHILENNSVLNGFNMMYSNDTDIKSLSPIHKYYYKYKEYVDYFVLNMSKIENKILNKDSCYFKYRSLELETTNNKTPIRFLKGMNMLSDIIDTIDNYSNDKNNGIYFSYINYCNSLKGKFEYKLLNLIDKKWYLDGVRNYNHIKNWQSNYKNLLQDFINSIYKSNHKYLLCFYSNSINFTEDKAIIKFIESNKVDMKLCEIESDGIKSSIFKIY